MKRVFLCLALIAAMVMGAEAQNRSITFEQTQEWKKIVKKAKKEKKLIFIDCYTSWCGPCKMLASKVFTQDAVADYFNGTFVNAKFDMEKDEDGVMLKDKYGVKAFPTLLFIDPVTQEAVHRMVGEVAAEYLNALSLDELATKDSWDLINKYVSDPLSEPLKQVMANRDKFYAVAGQEVVDYKLEESIRMAVLALAGWRPGMDTPFDEERNEELINYLLQIDFNAAPAGLAYLYTAEYIRKGNFRGLLDKMKEAMSYNPFRGSDAGFYFQQNIEALALCKDKALVEEGIRWIDTRCANTSDYFGKANLMDSKARLQTAIGDTLGADKSRMEEEKYTKEGERQSGGRVMRAVRMG